MKNFPSILVLMLFCFSLIKIEKAPAQRIYCESLQPGDLIFVTAKSTGWSNAINQVTNIREGANYAHVGIISSIAPGSIEVMHAAPERGVEVVSLARYIQDTTNHFDIFRLKIQHDIDWESVFAQGRAMLGAPYNFSYIMNDSSHYCSEFVFKMFKEYDVFDLEPMTFKVDGRTHEFWEKYYHELGMDVPEGLPGCNPNGLAADDDLEFMGRFFSEKK